MVPGKLSPAEETSLVTSLRARMKRRFGLKRDRRGVALIELIVSLIVIATASVGTTIAFFSAYGMLQQQRHRMRANEFLREETEYWQGRVHLISRLSEHERQQPRSWRDVIIDPRGPGAQDDVVGRIRRESIVAKNIIQTPQNPDYYEIPVVIQWEEPPLVPGDNPIPMEEKLVSYWIPANQ